MDALVEVVQSIYQATGVGVEANMGDVSGLLVVLFIAGASAVRLFSSSSTTETAPAPTETKQTTKAQPIQKIEKSFSERLSSGLSRSRSEVWGKLGKLFGGQHKLDQDLLDQVEELLYSADLGPKMVQDLLENLQKYEAEELTEDRFKAVLFDYLNGKMVDVQAAQATSLYETYKNEGSGPKVIMIVGVNGAGKTTTIGKLATKLTRQGAKVVVGACDTFRAAAVDQLQVWCERAGAEMVRAKEGANPSGVGYDALQRAQQINADYCLLDTAGRLHTKSNLMDELVKSRDVLKKLVPDAPHETLLVLDAITGQNALRQAEEFHKALNLTGLIFTKCDGSSKAGSAISIVHDLRVPLAFIGVGETVEDLDRFELKEYLSALLETGQTTH